MDSNFIVTDQVEIKAPASKVWEVLTQAEYYRQWDDLPEDFTAKELKMGSIIEWPGKTKMTVTEWEEQQRLRLSLFLPQVELKPTDYDITYGYYLIEKDGKTRLTLEVGDFSPLPDAQNYVNHSQEFVEAAMDRIKKLAEQGD